MLLTLTMPQLLFVPDAVHSKLLTKKQAKSHGEPLKGRPLRLRKQGEKRDRKQASKISGSIDSKPSRKARPRDYKQHIHRIHVGKEDTVSESLWMSM